MSNLYNQLMGENPLADKLLALLDLERKDFGRYRDIYLKNGGDRIIVYTRIGGANGAYYLQQTKKLGMHPLIWGAWDDSFDDTYHYVVFRVGDGMLEQAQELFKQQGGEPITVHEKFDAVNVEMASMSAEQLEAHPIYGITARNIKAAVKAGTKAIRFYDDDMPKELQL